jgi:hypothetical protein
MSRIQMISGSHGESASHIIPTLRRTNIRLPHRVTIPLQQTIGKGRSQLPSHYLGQHSCRIRPMYHPSPPVQRDRHDNVRSNLCQPFAALIPKELPHRKRQSITLGPFHMQNGIA